MKLKVLNSSKSAINLIVFHAIAPYFVVNLLYNVIVVVILERGP